MSLKRISPRRIFDIGLRRRDAYRRVFESPDGEEVLADLMNQCGWDKELFNEDSHVTANLLGRRWMILHIKSVLKITNQDLDRMMDNHRKQYEEE